MPDPKEARDTYLRAAAEGDVDTLRAMMTERARVEISRAETKALLARDKKAFVERRDALARENVELRGRATIFLAEGRTAVLGLEEGRFVVESAGLVGSRPKSVEEAILRLKQALADKDFDQLLGSLTEESAHRLATSLELLEKSLGGLSTAIFDVREDRATIEFADGRLITLRRENLVWKVEEIK